MSRTLAPALAWLFVALGVGTRAQAQDVGTLAVRAEPAPWGRACGLLPVCDAGTLLVSAAQVNDYGDVIDYRVFSSADGSRWQREALDDDIQLLGTSCIDGVTWAYGRPGIIARREPSGRWIVEHRMPEREEWNRRPEVGEVVRDRATNALRAWGIDFEGPFELVRSSDGTWSSPPRPRRRFFRPPVQPPECQTTRLRSRPRRGATFTRAMMCAGGRLLVWTSERARRPHAVVRLPESMRRQEWRVLGTDGDSIYLVAPVPWVLDGVEIDDTTHHVLARYREGNWASVTVEDPSVTPALSRSGGAPFALGTGRIYRFEEPNH